MHKETTVIGPFSQILTLQNLPLRGVLHDEDIRVISNGAVIIENGIITHIDHFEKIASIALKKNIPVNEVKEKLVLTPALIDSHTHLCFAGSRAKDYAMRVAGISYLDIAKRGGGIMSSVLNTRAASEEDLVGLTLSRLDHLVGEGVLTCEVKSGYGLTIEDELKMLSAIKKADKDHVIDIIPTCLAAHICPPEYAHPDQYLNKLLHELLPKIKQQSLSNRIDIFVEETAFDYSNAKYYLSQAQSMGFDITVHADQFHVMGSQLAVEMNALSADHLEASGEDEINFLSKSNTVANVLPGASLGLGMPFAPARKLLDAGCIVAIASDWNPGSAPMGYLLAQAALLGAAEKLSMAETWAGITFRAAKALNLSNKGIIDVGYEADLLAFPTEDYREILYQQGRLKPSKVWKKGNRVSFN